MKFSANQKPKPLPAAATIMGAFGCSNYGKGPKRPPSCAGNPKKATWPLCWTSTAGQTAGRQVTNWLPQGGRPSNAPAIPEL